MPPDAWQSVRRSVRVGDELLTPGRGIPPTRQAPFWVVEVRRDEVVIEIGPAGTRNRLPGEGFAAVVRHLKAGVGSPRIAAAHTTEPTPGSVDEVIRPYMRFDRALGNYVAAILQHAGLVDYVMKGRQKHVRLAPQ